VKACQWGFRCIQESRFFDKEKRRHS
jgi:hypothetical protein